MELLFPCPLTGSRLATAIAGCRLQSSIKPVSRLESFLHYMMCGTSWIPSMVACLFGSLQVPLIKASKIVVLQKCMSWWKYPGQLLPKRSELQTPSWTSQITFTMAQASWCKCECVFNQFCMDVCLQITLITHGSGLDPVGQLTSTYKYSITSDMIYITERRHWWTSKRTLISYEGPSSTHNP